MNEITMKIRSSGKKILLAMTLALVFAGCGEPAGSSGGNDEYGSTNGDDKKISVSGGEGSEFSVAFEPQGGVWSRDIPEDFWKNVVNADGTVNLPTDYIQRGGMMLLGWYDRAQPSPPPPRAIFEKRERRI